MRKTSLISDNNRPLKMRWVMIGFAFLATVLNYVHRLSFNYLSATGDLREIISNEAFGYIGTAFFIAYTISNAFSGYIIDRLGTRIGYSLCMLVWNTAGLFHAYLVFCYFLDRPILSRCTKYGFETNRLVCDVAIHNCRCR